MGGGVPMRIFTTCLMALLLAGTVFGQASKRVQASDFKTSEYCKQCHTQIHQQWSTSTHSNAYRDPIYQVFLRRVDEASQSRLTQFCVSCHAPLATMTKTVPAKLFDGQ